MIERHVFFKLTQEKATAEAREEIVREARARFVRIPGVTRVAAGTPADPASESAWDVCLTVEFARLEDVEPYRAHPIHREFLDLFVNPRLAVVKAWNFVV